jgi:hypothetical protein
MPRKRSSRQRANRSGGPPRSYSGQSGGTTKKNSTEASQGVTIAADASAALMGLIVGAPANSSSSTAPSAAKEKAKTSKVASLFFFNDADGDGNRDGDGSARGSATADTPEEQMKARMKELIDQDRREAREQRHEERRLEKAKKALSATSTTSKGKKGSSSKSKKKSKKGGAIAVEDIVAAFRMRGNEECASASVRVSVCLAKSAKTRKLVVVKRGGGDGDEPKMLEELMRQCKN